MPQPGEIRPRWLQSCHPDEPLQFWTPAAEAEGRGQELRPQFFPVRLKDTGQTDGRRWPWPLPRCLALSGRCSGSRSGPSRARSQLLAGHLEAGFRSRRTDSQRQPSPRAARPSSGKESRPGVRGLTSGFSRGAGDSPCLSFPTCKRGYDLGQLTGSP